MSTEHLCSGQTISIQGLFEQIGQTSSENGLSGNNSPECLYSSRVLIH